MSKSTATPPAAARPATGKVKPLRIDAELDNEIKRVAKIIGLNDADTMRKALERGLPMVEELLKPAYKKAA